MKIKKYRSLPSALTRQEVEGPTPERSNEMPNITMKPCEMCLNARVCPELNDENDFSAHSIGECESGFRIMIESGWGQPLEITFERFINSEWHFIGIYYPKFCPNCGRPLIEYKRKE